MNAPVLSDHDRALIAVTVSAAPALTSDQLYDLRRVFQPRRSTRKTPARSQRLANLPAGRAA